MKHFSDILKSIIFLLLCLVAGPSFAQQISATDSDITDRVETEMTWQMNIPADDIDIQTHDKIVVLDGQVDNVFAKERAAKVAGAVRSVQGVVNNIKVIPPHVTDDQLVTDVVQALTNDPATDSYEIIVSADNGVISLNGIVDSWTERNLSESVAMRVVGVREVKNEIDVQKTKDRPDEEIKLEIEQAINNDIRLYPRMVDVKVQNGNVTLAGIVGSWNDVFLVKQYAWTAGVEEIDAHALKVEKWVASTNLRRSRYVSRSDKEIKSAVENALRYDPRVISFKPKVKVDDGVITLSGTVSNLMAKRAAGSDAQNIVGVVLVKNNLRVRPTEVPTGTELVDRVEKAFDRDAELNHLPITVSGQNGKVYLRGKVENSYESYRAEEIASNVKGVKTVVNILDVYYDDPYAVDYPRGIHDENRPASFTLPGTYYRQHLTDMRIKENIKEEFRWSPYVDQSDITVSVSAQVATLKGEIDSWWERKVAIENAYEGGADSVVDKLVIKKAEASDTGSLH